MEARVAVGAVLRVDAGPARNEQPRALAVAGVGREEERRVALERTRVRVRSRIQQRTHHRRLTLHLHECTFALPSPLYSNMDSSR
jgi:hypothetical protein